MGDHDEEVQEKKKKKFVLSEQPGSLPPVLWSPARPRPAVSPGIWGDAEGEELAKYIDWHHNHPHTVTPRKVKYGPDGEIIGGQLFHETDHTLAYSLNGQRPPPLPEEYRPTFLGADADLDEVSTIAMRYSYSEQLLYNAEHDDPWYSMSVKDQLETSHVDGSHTTCKWRPKSPPPASKFDKELAWQMEEYGEYQGGSPPLTKDRIRVIHKLSLMDKDLIHGQRVKRSPWEQDNEFTRFTRNGTALNDFKKVELERKVRSALTAYEEDSRILQKFINKSRKSSKKSAKVVPVTSDTDRYEEMKAHLGGAKALDNMSRNWVEFGKKVTAKSKMQADAFSFSLDLLEACEKLRVVKVQTVLLATGDPNVNTPEDEPLFIYLFNRALKMDSVTGLTKYADEMNDASDRKKLQKILELFVKHGVTINGDNGRDQLAPIHLAVIADNVKMLHWCLNHGGDKEYPTKSEHMVPLMLAAKYGHVQCLGELVKQGAAVNFQEEDSGNSALHFAGLFGQTRGALFLLRIGASKKLTNKSNQSAAELAFQGNYLATAQAISSFAEGPKRVAPQLEYVLEQEKKVAKACGTRRQGVTTSGTSATLLALANNAMNAYNVLSNAVAKGVKFVLTRLNLLHYGDKVDEEEEELEMLAEVDDTGNVIEADKIQRVLDLAKATKEVRGNDEVEPF